MRQDTGWLVYYYSNQETGLPVRDVQKPWDEKTDPNLETGTYGLFSTCAFAMRNQVFNRGDRYLFFYTNREGKRIVTGYYDLGAYVKTGFVNRGLKVTYGFPDYAFLAKKIHFVEAGIPFTERRGMQWQRASISDDGIDGFGLRTPQRLNEEETAQLIQKLNSQGDRTPEYVKQIIGLEEENLARVGYRYPTFQQGKYMKKLLSSGFNTSIMDEYLF